MLAPPTPPTWEELLAPISSRRLAEVLAWFEDRRVLGRPETSAATNAVASTLTSGELRLLARLEQASSRNPIPMHDESGRQLTFRPVSELAAFFHQLDRKPSLHSADMAPESTWIERDELAVRARMREAVASCALDGIRVDTETCLDVLRCTRPPRNADETALMRCYDALCELAEVSRSALSVESVLLLHVQLQGTEAMMPPLRLRSLVELCAFANGESGADFVHPFVRACAVQLMMARHRLLPAGEGRLPRIVFLRLMLQHGYEGFALLSLSQVMDGQARAVLAEWTSSREPDLTAPLLAMANLVRRSVETLRADAAATARERLTTARTLNAASSLNPRQLALLTHAARHPGAIYTIETHRRCHDVVYQTARTDLLNLARKGLLSISKRGKAFVFHRVAPPGPEPVAPPQKATGSFTSPIPEDLGFPL